MIFNYRVDGYTITDQDKTIIEEKITKLEKFDSRVGDESAKAHIEVVRGTRHQTPNFGVHAQLFIPGHSLRAEASGKTIPDAIDEVERKLRAQIERIKA